jgi:hypothetical protein
MEKFLKKVQDEISYTKARRKYDIWKKTQDDWKEAMAKLRRSLIESKIKTKEHEEVD